MTARKKVEIISMMRMLPACHPKAFFDLMYIVERGGDSIVVKCSKCYSVFFQTKPRGKEKTDAN